MNKTHVWGQDLSGTMQGAGGGGGLLSTTNYTNDQASEASSFYPAYDANGNITEYVDEAGVVQAHYQYDEFGKTLASSGTKSDDFGFRFSTKLLDDESSHYYYGYRYYTPQTGKWLSRDPIAEEGRFNLYGFNFNDPVGKFDLLGTVTLSNARSSLKSNNIQPLCSRLGFKIYCDNQVFDEWLRLELEDTSWLNRIPSCPSEICIENGEPKDCDNGNWGSITGPGLHSGATWCMRSKSFGGSAQQCCYGSDGKLKDNLPAAGTPDRVAAGGTGHFFMM